MKRLFTNTGLLLLFPLMLAAQSMVGTKAAPFLGIEVGGRSLGMGGANVASVTIPGGVSRVGSNQFRNRVSLMSVAVPDSVADIGAFAFIDCTGLTNVFSSIF